MNLEKLREIIESIPDTSIPGEVLLKYLYDWVLDNIPEAKMFVKEKTTLEFKKIEPALPHVKITDDSITNNWILEIANQTELTIKEILNKVTHIQKHGHGKFLTRTTSDRVPLARIAEDYGVNLSGYETFRGLRKTARNEK